MQISRTPRSFREGRKYLLMAATLANISKSKDASYPGGRPAGAEDDPLLEEERSRGQALIRRLTPSYQKGTRARPPADPWRTGLASRRGTAFNAAGASPSKRRCKDGGLHARSPRSRSIRSVEGFQGGRARAEQG